MAPPLPKLEAQLASATRRGIRRSIEPVGFTVALIQLSEHADQAGKGALLERIEETPQVQFCYELAGTYDLLLLFDCCSMAEFNDLTERVLQADSTVRRYKTSFVKREDKFAPFVELATD